MAMTSATKNRLSSMAKEQARKAADALRSNADLGLSQSEAAALSSAVGAVRAANSLARELNDVESVLKAYGFDQTQDGIGAIARLLAETLNATGTLDVYNYDPALIELRQTASARRAEVPLNAILHSFGLAVAQGVVDVVSRSYTPNTTGAASSVNVFPSSQDASSDAYISFGAPPDVPYASNSYVTGYKNTTGGSAPSITTIGQTPSSMIVARADNGSTKRNPAIIPAVLLETSVQQNTGVLSSITASLEGVFSNEHSSSSATTLTTGGIALPPDDLPVSGVLDAISDSTGTAISVSGKGVMTPVSIADGFNSGRFVYSARTYVNKCPMAIFPYQKREGKTYIRPLAIQPEVFANASFSVTNPSTGAVTVTDYYQVLQKGFGVRLNIIDAAVGTNIELQLITAIHELFPAMYDLALSALINGGRVVE